MRILSGIQPSGELHIGNYLGAFKQFVDLQNDEHEGYYFVANFHALTTIRNQEEMQKRTLEVAMAFLAFGLDPQRSVLFLQSDIPEVPELTWLLGAVTPMGLLQRCHAYKEKVEQGIAADFGLFAYPVLMAADILIYDSNLVPVGQDQKQHVEVTRDIAVKFNETYGEVLTLPEPKIISQVATVPGTDGRKMSKSYGNVITLFCDEAQTKREVMSIVTDSTPVGDPKDPEACNLFAVLRLFAEEDELAEVERLYREGGAAYGTLKKRLVELVNDHLRPARERYAELENDPDRVRDVLRDGAARARATAQVVLERCRDACGMIAR